ncbi:GDSL-type esterase/lipase family protein [Rhizobium sp. RU36D]|uniref:GDSL-type esterase/lipase family protein n=1 Tax=Rhizobium sp. RU36D TaxID=1907415 RepID=UPI0009D82963|nr:GDSL-type esterase/lipase family protein [Rhizobium sp. RU36D]SMD15726.1 Lysophospholipase L1 [Rhizobium sp. RU36D]
MKYYRELKELIPKSTDILFIGDSIFQFWPQAIINKYTGGKSSFKFAVGSDRTQSILWRLQDTNLQPLNPQRVVLLMGTNNLGDSAPACAVLVATKQILDRIYKMWPNVSVTIVEVLPREEGFTGRQEQRLSLNAQLRTLKDLYPKLTTVNVDYQMSCGIVADPLQQSGNPPSEMKDVQCGNFLPDLVHPAPPGYEVLGAALQPFFTDQGK